MMLPHLRVNINSAAAVAPTAAADDDDDERQGNFSFKELLR